MSLNELIKQVLKDANVTRQQLADYLKANNIRKDYLLRGIHLSLESFLKEYKTDLNKNDFIQYYAQKSFERWNKGMISNETYEKEKGTLKKLQKFYTVIPFHEFNADWPNDFDRQLKRDINTEINPELRKKEISINGRWPRHKHVKTYLNIAKRIVELEGGFVYYSVYAQVVKLVDTPL